MIGNTSLSNQYKERISELGQHFHHPHFYLGLGIIKFPKTFKKCQAFFDILLMHAIKVSEKTLLTYLV